MTLRNLFGPSFWAFAALGLVSGIACWHLVGRAAVVDGLRADVDLIVFLLPRFAGGMLVAAFLTILLPRDLIARHAGDQAGLKAVAVATAAGIATPGGPMTSFPIVCALRDAGTGRGALVAYVTSWSTLGFNRVLNWELPLLGPEITAVRYLSSLPLPFAAGLTARLWPGRDAAPAPTEERDGR